MEEKKNYIKKRYADIAKKNTSCCPTCDSCGPDLIEQAEAIGYSKDELKGIPKTAVMGLGCGNPTGIGELRPGEVVVDLGSGGGIDVFLAANKVGETGKVIGVDMTEEMIKKGRENAKKGSYSNVEFRLGEIENLPIENSSCDVVVSNCVINLSLDKVRTFKEAYRVLKPGGRIAVSDIVTEGELPKELRKNLEAWTGCIGGALQKQEYIDAIKRAGFEKIKVISERDIGEGWGFPETEGKIISVQIEARKSEA